jgi:hypothetical protein
MDYGRDVEFGNFPAPNADDYLAIVEQTRIAVTVEIRDR